MKVCLCQSAIPQLKVRVLDQMEAMVRRTFALRTRSLTSQMRCIQTRRRRHHIPWALKKKETLAIHMNYDALLLIRLLSLRCRDLLSPPVRPRFGAVTGRLDIIPHVSPPIASLAWIRPVANPFRGVMAWTWCELCNYRKDHELRDHQCRYCCARICQECGSASDGRRQGDIMLMGHLSMMSTLVIVLRRPGRLLYSRQLCSVPFASVRDMMYLQSLKNPRCS